MTIPTTESLYASVRRFRDALEKIAAMESVKEVRGGFEEYCTPDHLVKEGGWVPIHPRTKQGIMIAVRIAKKALEEDV